MATSKNAPASITFDISAVTPAQDGPNMITLKGALEKVVKSEVEACSNPQALALQPYGFNVFFETLHRAYDEHRPIVLTPDNIWLTISQGFAQIVNANPEAYRHAFVSHASKETIVIDRQGFVRGYGGNNWADCFPEFSKRICEYVGHDTHSLILSNFSTTGEVERAASEIVLMDTVQAYFEFVVRTRCGIPSATLLGATEDWKKLALKAKALESRFEGLGFWLQSIHPVLDQFISVTEGNEPDLNFWRNIYKGEKESGGIHAYGHLLKLVPYINTYRGTVKNPVLTGNSGVSTSNLPQALACVPFTWDYHGQKFDYQFLAGHVAIGVAQNGSVTPLVGWAVRPKP